MITVVERDVDPALGGREQQARRFGSARTARTYAPLGSSAGSPVTIFVQVLP